MLKQIAVTDFVRGFGPPNIDKGYLPVSVCMKDGGAAVRVDMICQWRLRDGKILFLEIPFDNKTELEAVLDVVQAGIEALATAIRREVDDTRRSFEENHR